MYAIRAYLLPCNHRKACRETKWTIRDRALPANSKQISLSIEAPLNSGTLCMVRDGKWATTHDSTLFGQEVRPYFHTPFFHQGLQSNNTHQNILALKWKCPNTFVPHWGFKFDSCRAVPDNQNYAAVTKANNYSTMVSPVKMSRQPAILSPSVHFLPLTPHWTSLWALYQGRGPGVCYLLLLLCCLLLQNILTGLHSTRLAVPVTSQLFVCQYNLKNEWTLKASRE